MRWRRTVPVLLATGLLACSDPSGTGGDVHVAVLVDQAVLSQADTAEVTVVVTNVSMRKLKIDATSCPSNFQVIDSGGHVIEPWSSRFCLGILILAELSPGESHSFNYTWRPLDTSSEPLAPGAYRIRGFARTEDGRYRSEPVDVTIN